jgi:O-antigen/teichoic acid export membrane protein
MNSDLLTRFRALERMSGIVDQAIYSVVTLGQILVFSRILSPDDFGMYSVVQGGCMFLQSIQRAVIVLPMIMGDGKPGGQYSWGRYDTLFRGGVTSIGMGFAAIAFALGGRPQLAIGLGLAALCSFAVLGYEFQRRCLFLTGEKRAIFLNALSYGFFNLVPVAIVLIAGGTLGRAVAAYVTGFILPAIVAYRLRRVEKRKIDLRIGDYRHIIVWNLLAFLPYSIYNSGMVLIVAATSDLRTVAAFSVSRVFVAPVQALVQAIDSVDKIRARRQFAEHGTKGLAASLSSTRMTLLALGLPYILLVMATAAHGVPALLGHKYAAVAPMVRMWMLVGLFTLLTQPIESGLLILGRSNWIFWTRTAAAVMTVAVLAVARTALATVGPVLGLAVGWGVGGLLGWVVLHHALRARSGGGLAWASSGGDALKVRKGEE